MYCGMAWVVYFMILTLLVSGVNAKSHFRPGQIHEGTNNGPHFKSPQEKGAEDDRDKRLIQAPKEQVEHAGRFDDIDNDLHQHPRASYSTSHAEDQHTGVDWMQRGQDELEEALNVWPKWKPARNVIYFIGDGMGVSSLTAGRIFKAQREGKSVTEGRLSWEDLPHTGVVKTYNTDQQVSDSAGTATAFACGEKTRAGVIGVNENTIRQNCSTVAGNELRSIVHHAQDEGKWAGIVTTSRVTHSTPASAFAHSADRYWEADYDVPPADRETCWDIARQLVHNEDNKILRVMLGGGRRGFFNRTVFDNEYPTYYGDRLDGRDLRQEWLDVKAGMGLADTDYKYVENKTDFDSVDANTIQYLFGMFEPSHMKYETDRLEETGDTWTEPSLAEMVQKALDILKRAPNGYVLYVESGRIDHAHHASNAHRALVDLVAMEEAVALAMNQTDEEDTLLLVTADHSHTFAISGYPKLDNNILGLVIDQDEVMNLANDRKPWLTLGYANGPGFVDHRSSTGQYEDEIPRRDLRNDTTTEKEYLQDSPIPLDSGTHGGEDVLVYARGPMAHLFSGQHEQHYIAHAAMYAACLGWNKDLCETNPSPPGTC